MTQEIARSLGRWRIEDLRGRTLLDNATGVEHGNPIADASRE